MEFAKLIGNRLGEFEELDREAAWGAYMRIRVRLNVTKTLKRVLKIQGPTGEVMVVNFSYERLPNFCYLCGKLDHIERDCELHYELGGDIEPNEMPYGQCSNRSYGFNQSGPKVLIKVEQWG